jgi:hypothetical protein
MKNKRSTQKRGEETAGNKTAFPLSAFSGGKISTALRLLLTSSTGTGEYWHLLVSLRVGFTKIREPRACKPKMKPRYRSPGHFNQEPYPKTFKLASHPYSP